MVDTEVNLSDLLEIKVNAFSISDKANFWLKPIGSAEKFISINEKFFKSENDLYFARNPKGVKKGDILITYAVGYKKVLSVFRVLSSVKYSENAEDRWHYYLVGENLTKYFGNEWNRHDIHISAERDNFINLTKSNVTPSGKNSYGTLQRGGDKLKITSEFGNYLINKIVNINNEILASENEL